MTDKEKQIEKMAFSICPMPQAGEYITDCSKCGYNGDCRDKSMLKSSWKKATATCGQRSRTWRSVSKWRFIMSLTSSFRPEWRTR